MNRLSVMLALACVVVSQTKKQTGWLTDCQGVDGNGQVVLDKQMVIGQEADFRPFVFGDDEIIHGEVVNVQDAPKMAPKVETSSNVGKDIQ